MRSRAESSSGISGGYTGSQGPCSAKRLFESFVGEACSAMESMDDDSPGAGEAGDRAQELSVDSDALR